MPEPIFISLAAGVQTEIADQLVEPGSTLVLENCESEKTGATQVRVGSDLLVADDAATIPPGGTVPEVWQLATLERALVRFGQAPIPIHTLAPVPGAWVSPANLGGLETYRRGPIKLDVTNVFAGTAQVSDPDVAVGTDTIVEVYDIDTGLIGTTGVVTTILDRATRRPVYTRRVGGGARGGRVVIVGARAVVAYESGGFLQVDSYNLTTCALAQQQTMGALDPGTPIDMRVGSPVVGASNVAILYLTVTSAELRIATVDATNLSTNSTITPRVPVGLVIVPDLGFGWMQDFGAAGKFAIMYADTTDGVQVAWNLPAPSAGVSEAAAHHQLDGAATAGVRNLIGTTITSSSSGVYRVLYEVENLAPVQIKVGLYNAGATTATQFRSVGIRSKFWQHAGNFYFLAAFDAQDQRSYFVLATSGDTTISSTTFAAPLAVSHPRDAGGLTENTFTASAAAVDADGAIYIAVTQETRTDSVTDGGGEATGGTETLLGIDLIRVRHQTTAETELGKPAEYLRSLFVPGALLGVFDGSTFAAAGFAYYPTGADLASQTGGNLDPSANYLYRFVYSFVDRNGRTWRSAPSTPVAASTTGTDFSFDIDVPTLRLVDRGLASGHNGFSIEAYRTQANATEGYFQVAVIANDPTADTVSFTDNVADDDLGTQLYTDGGGVENQLLPPIAWAVEHQGRIVCGEQGTGTLWYSTEADFISGPIFNEALTFDVGDPAEPTTGGAVFNEQLFVFKGEKSYLVGGQFADALGRGANLAYRLLDGGVGCDNPQSIAVADGGVWFRSGGSRAGIHKTSGGEPEYVGGGVRAQNDLTITSAVVVHEKNQIRWFTLEGTTLVWDWIRKAWGTNTDQDCRSATDGYGADDEIVYARESDSAILIESTTVYLEADVPYNGRIRSPWFKYGIGGWQRIKRIQGQGRVGTGRQHIARVSLYKDLDDSAAFQTAEISFDGTEELWHWEMRPAQQKCSAMMVEVEILPYQPPDETIEGDVGDSYEGAGVWNFINANFEPTDVGGTIVITGAPSGKNGTYTITVASDPNEITLSPLPGDTTTGALGVEATIVFTPPEQSTKGPEILGVTLVPMQKEGAEKLAAARRLT